MYGVQRIKILFKKIFIRSEELKGMIGLLAETVLEMNSNIRNNTARS